MVALKNKPTSWFLSLIARKAVKFKIFLWKTIWYEKKTCSFIYSSKDFKTAAIELLQRGKYCSNHGSVGLGERDKLHIAGSLYQHLMWWELKVDVQKSWGLSQVLCSSCLHLLGILSFIKLLSNTFCVSVTAIGMEDAAVNAVAKVSALTGVTFWSETDKKQDK